MRMPRGVTPGRRWIPWVLPWLLSSGCGAVDPQAEHAGRTVALGWQVVTEAEETVRDEPRRGERDLTAAEAAVAQAHERFERAQGVVRIWQDEGVGELGWYTLVPCLAAALDRLERVFHASELPVPGDLDQARQMASQASQRDCAERRR